MQLPIPVVVRKQKFDGSAKPDWHGDLVDAIGDRWLVVYHPEPHVTPWRARQALHGVRYYGLDIPLTVLVSFDERGQLLEYQCDAALPATIEGRTITFVDLDLDVIADASLAYYVRDHDEFERRRVEMRYSPEAIAAAHEGVDRAIALIEARATPFDDHPAAVLGRVPAAQGPI